MRSCISLPMSLEGVGSVCLLSCTLLPCHDFGGGYLGCMFLDAWSCYTHDMGDRGCCLVGKRFTVLCPAVHRAAPYLRNAVSPDHSSNEFDHFLLANGVHCG
jgi:hypothetical protein